MARPTARSRHCCIQNQLSDADAAAAFERLTAYSSSSPRNIELVRSLVCSRSRGPQVPSPPVHAAMAGASATAVLAVAPRPVCAHGGRSGCGCGSVRIRRRRCDNGRCDNGRSDRRGFHDGRGRTHGGHCGCCRWRRGRVIVRSWASLAAGRQQQDRWHESQQQSALESPHGRPPLGD